MADMYHFDGTDSRMHADISTVHEDKDCHHLSDARIYDVPYVPDDATVCGTCGSDDETDEGAGASEIGA